MSRIIDIEAIGITCGDCSFNCDLEDVLDHFSIQNKERAEKKYRSGYSANCRKCTGIRSQTNYRKRRLASNPDYEPTRIHFWDVTSAECTHCHGIFPHSDFTKSGPRSTRPVSPTCKNCTSDKEWEKRRNNIKLTKYKHYKSIMRSEGNDCDMTYEKFERDFWPKDNKCPILGHELKTYPREERGKWKGGRHYPYTPCVDHVDPRLPMDKNNLQIISWRANELKSDAIPEEIELLYRNLELRDDRYWKGSIMDIVSSGQTEHLQNKLSKNNWVGKYTGDRKL